MGQQELLLTMVVRDRRDLVSGTCEANGNQTVMIFC